MRSARWFIIVGSVNAFIAIGAGAFGAHALREQLAPAMQEVFQTAAHYHLIHAVAVVAIAALIERWHSTALIGSGLLLSAGMVLFSGSLYALALSNVKALGVITPLGGLCFLAGWLLLALGAWRQH